MKDDYWESSKKEYFNIIFHGPAVDNHEIDAEDLATSLMGISNVIDEAHKTLFDSKYSEIYLKVSGDLKPGSFLVSLVLFLTSTNFEALTNLLSLLGFSGLDANSLIQLIRKSEGNKISNKTKISGDQYNVTFENCTFNPNLNEDSIRLLENKKIRKSLNTITKVLNNNGIIEIEFKDQDGESEFIRKEDVEYFKLPEEELEDEKIDEDIFIITRPDFKGRKKGWRFSFGYVDELATDFAVTILDEDFLHGVKNGNIPISQDTKIRAQYRKSIVELEKLSVRYEIIKVLEVGQVKRKYKDLSDFS